MIDVYSADIYQRPAGGKAIKSDQERIESLRRFGPNISLNTQYAILSVTDSFNGPVKSVDKYDCELGKGPKIVFAKRSYF